MRDSDWSESLVLAEWADEECRHLDLIHSWETLLSVYETLGFQDHITDETRLAEFKFVIGETNKFLTRMRNGLMKTRTIDDAIEFLAQHVNTKDMNNVKGREQIAYNKLKQRWILQSIYTLRSQKPQAEAEEGERDD